MVEYTYDPYGKQLTCTGTLASTIGQINPFRYRGYVYDAETGLYYLNSRYYDPETGRFLNADRIISYGLLTANVYNYCFNDPINHTDRIGCFPTWNDFLNTVKKAYNSVASAVTSFCKSFSNDYNCIGKAKVDINYDDYDDIPIQSKDRLRGHDAKAREKKQIKDAFGKRGSKEREQKSRDLHDKKKSRGGGNDQNESWDELNEYVVPVVATGIVVSGTVVVCVLVVDDATGIGAADDFLLPGVFAYIGQGIALFAH